MPLGARLDRLHIKIRRWKPKRSRIVEILVLFVIQVGLALPSAPTYPDHLREWTWRHVTFLVTFIAAVFAAGLILLFDYREQSYVEPERIRRRCHKVLRGIADTLFARHNNVEVTLLLPLRQGTITYLVPSVRFDRTQPDEFIPSNSMSVFTTGSTSLISTAWDNRMQVVTSTPDPMPIFQTRSEAEGWYQHHLKLDKSEAVRLSDRTLTKIRWLWNIGLEDRFTGEPIGLLAMSSASAPPTLTQDDLQALKVHLVLLSVLVANGAE